MTALRGGALGGLRGVAVPSYDRGAVTAGIVHVGVGAFARSHLAVHVERLLEGGETAWGVCGLGTRPADRRTSEVLQAQDGLYALLVKHPDGRLDAQVVGALVDHLHAPDDPEAAVERLAATSTRLVTLTITEGGYQVDPVSGRFTPVEPAVLLDLQPGAAPSTVFGLVVEALVRRRARGVPPFAVVPLDNVAHNGAVAREALSGFAARRDPALGAWVRAEVAFPSSMVDRITPRTAPEDVALLADRFGVEDGAPVVCEPYLQ